MKSKKNRPILSLTKQHQISAISGSAYIVAVILYYASRRIDNKTATIVIMIAVALLAIISLSITISSDILFRKEKEDEGANDSLNKGMILSKTMSLFLGAIIIFIWYFFANNKVIQVGVLDFSLVWYGYVCLGEIITSITFLILESSLKAEDSE